MKNVLCFFLARRVYVAQGPHDIWHCDSYGKMKPFGFPIHVAVDGFSRKILWLAVVKLNNNPVVPAALYLRAVKEHGVSPILFKTDCGFENADMAGLQCYLTKNFSSHRYAASHSKPAYRKLMVTFSKLIFWLGNGSFQRISS